MFILLKTIFFPNSLGPLLAHFSTNSQCHKHRYFYLHKLLLSHREPLKTENNNNNNKSTPNYPHTHRCTLEHSSYSTCDTLQDDECKMSVVGITVWICLYVFVCVCDCAYVMAATAMLSVDGTIAVIAINLKWPKCCCNVAATPRH